MDIATCLRLADYARNDRELISNHCQPKGVDYYLKKHLSEVNYLLEELAGHSDYVDKLKLEKETLERALEVYNPLLWGRQISGSVLAVRGGTK